MSHSFWHPRRSFQLARIPAMTAISCLTLVTIALAACTTPTPTITQEPPVTSTPTLIPLHTPTPTPEPLGSSQNPVVMGFVSETMDVQAIAQGESAADQIGTRARISIRALPFSDYDQLLDAMADDQVHIAWLPPFTYLVARNRGFAEVGLISNHFGTYSYGFQILANNDSQLTPYFDQQTNISTAPAETALPQLQQLRPCWIDEQSASGYIAPLGLLTQLGLTLEPGVFTRSHSSTVRSLYIGGICDFGATYAYLGDARTGDGLLTDLPDVMQTVMVIWQSDAIIPNLNVTFTRSLPADLRQRIQDALVEYARTSEGQNLLSQALAYQVEALKIVDDRIYDVLRNYQESSGVWLASLRGK